MALNARQRRLLKQLRAESRKLAWQIAACEDRIIELQNAKLKTRKQMFNSSPSERIGLHDLRILAEAYRDRVTFLERARERGATFKNIGLVLGVSTQAAWSACHSYGIQ